MLEPIKVLHVTGAMNRGGAEVMLMDLFKNVSGQFHFDFLVNYKTKEGIIKGDFDDEILSEGAKIKHIQTQWNIGPIKYIKEFKRICSEIGRPDIVHIHMNAKGGVIALAAKKAGINNIIVHSHADLKFRGRLISRIASKTELFFQKILISRYANYFWGCSIEANNSLFYKRLLTPDKSKVINNAIDLSAYIKPKEIVIKALKDSYSLGPKTIVFGNVGRIVRHKNISFLLNIFKELKNQKIDFIFVYAGRIADQVYHEEFIAKAKELNLDRELRYLGVRADVPEVFHSFDVFLGPALQEGFGMVAIEAQAAGVPCILYKGFPKIVDLNLELVTFVDDFDLKNWTNSIDKLPNKLKDKSLIEKTVIEKGFDIKSNVRQIEKYYCSMMNK